MANNLATDYDAKSPHDEILTAARENIGSWFSYFAKNNEKALANIYFTYIDQWDEKDRAAREAKFKPVLSVNKILPAVRAVIGELRDNTPNIEIRADGAKVKQKVVDIYNDATRYIAYKSKATQAYQTAFESAYVAGYGVIRINYDYKPGKTFEKQISIEAIRDPISCFFDPQAKLPDKSDGRFSGISTCISREQFDKEYPDYEGTPQPFYGGNSFSYDDNQFYWGDEDSIVICDYYYKKWFNKEIFELDDGRVVDAKELKELQQQYQIDIIKYNSLPTNVTPSGQVIPAPPAPTVASSRTMADYQIRHARLIYNDVLDDVEYPSNHLPIIFVDGASIIYKGEQITQGYVEKAIDPQRLYNYVNSEIAHSMLSTIKAKWLVTATHTEGFEQEWQDPDANNILPYNTDAQAGPPQLINPTPFSSMLLNVLSQSENDIQDALGRYEESNGEQTNAISGAAIYNRQLAGNMTNEVFVDNLVRGVESIWRCVVSMIPRVWDTERTMSVMTKAGKVKSVKVNEQKADKIQNDITQGEYLTHVEIGASFALQKAKALDYLMQIFEKAPQTQNLLIDKICELLDIENMPEIVARVQTLVPQDIIAEENGEPPPPPPQPTKQEQMQEQMAEVKMMSEIESVINDRMKTMSEMAKTAEESQEAKLNAISKSVQAMADMMKAESTMTEQQIKANQGVVEQTQQFAGDVSQRYDQQADTTQQVLSQASSNREAKKQQQAQKQEQAQAEQAQQQGSAS